MACKTNIDVTVIISDFLIRAISPYDGVGLGLTAGQTAAYPKQSPPPIQSASRSHREVTGSQQQNPIAVQVRQLFR